MDVCSVYSFFVIFYFSNTMFLYMAWCFDEEIKIIMWLIPIGWVIHFWNK